MKITLCGSTRFGKEFQEWNARLTLQGHLVYSLGMFGRQASDEGKAEDQPLLTDEDKRHLDLVHLSKIEESEAIFVVNPGGYIGDSTRREIEWARLRGKEIFGVVGYSELPLWLSPRFDFLEVVE